MHAWSCAAHGPPTDGLHRPAAGNPRRRRSGENSRRAADRRAGGRDGDGADGAHCLCTGGGLHRCSGGVGGGWVAQRLLMLFVGFKLFWISPSAYPSTLRTSQTKPTPTLSFTRPHGCSRHSAAHHSLHRPLHLPTWHCCFSQPPGGPHNCIHRVCHGGERDGWSGVRHGGASDWQAGDWDGAAAVGRGERRAACSWMAMMASAAVGVM